MTEVKKVKLKVECPVIDETNLTFHSSNNFVDQGAYGKVCKAEYEGKAVAVKYFKSAEEKRGYKQELVFLTCLQKHENIVNLFGTGSSLKTKEPYIVMEYAPYSLEKVLHHGYPRYVYGADHVMHWSRQMAVGLKYIHSKRILHRDIKSSNLLLFGNGSHLKLCDFGTCRNLETNLLYTASIGTVRYMAPEVIQGESYTTLCDIFSFAITLWEMVARKIPTIDSNANSYAILFQMVQGKRPPLLVNVPRFINELLTRCWHQDPTVRLSSVDLEKKLTKVCQYFPYGRPLAIEEEEEESEEEEEEEDEEEEEEEEKDEIQEEKPVTAILKESHSPGISLARTRSDMTLAKSLNNNTTPVLPPHNPIPSSVMQQMTSQRSQPFEGEQADHFHHGYPPRDHYVSPKKSVSPAPEPFMRESEGKVAVVHHEFHEMLDPHLQETQYTSLDENRLRFDIQCQYQQIEQAYSPSSLPSSYNRTETHAKNRQSAPVVNRLQRPASNYSGMNRQAVQPVESDPESLRMFEQFQKLSGRLAQHKS